MPLHPQAEAVLRARSTGKRLDLATLDVARFRAAFEVPAPTSAVTFDGTIEDRRVDTGTSPTDLAARGPIGVRTYTPSGPGPFPLTLYYHGGGFVLGSPATTDAICRRLASGSSTVVVSVDYRLAPEARFPAAVDDAYAALRWVVDNAGQLNGIASLVAVAGDSSGGNLAAVVAQMARARGPALCHQLLLYPVLDYAFQTASYGDFADGYLLTEAMMRWFWQQYVADGTPPDDVRLSPARERNLSGLPGATIVTAEYDVLRDEAEGYARALEGAGVQVRLRRWAGQIHGFLLMQGAVDDAAIALVDAAECLRMAFAPGLAGAPDSLRAER